MSRLQVLKQRAARGECGVFEARKREWLVGTGRGQGDCAGPFVSYREAIQFAARWALPHKKQKMYVNDMFVGYV